MLIFVFAGHRKSLILLAFHYHHLLVSLVGSQLCCYITADTYFEVFIFFLFLPYDVDLLTAYIYTHTTMISKCYIPALNPNLVNLVSKYSLR